MKILPILIFPLTLSLLAGCQAKLDWTGHDGGRADPARLKEAQKKCRIEIKLAGLDRAETERDEKLRQSSSDEAKMLVRDEFDQIRRQVYREIDSCMNKLGYRR